MMHAEAIDIIQQGGALVKMLVKRQAKLHTHVGGYFLFRNSSTVGLYMHLKTVDQNAKKPYEKHVLLLLMYTSLALPLSKQMTKCFIREVYKEKQIKRRKELVNKISKTSAECEQVITGDSSVKKSHKDGKC